MIDTNTQKQKLIEEKESLVKQLSSMGVEDSARKDWEAVPEVADDSIVDENDMADRFEEFEQRSATLSVFEARLKDIEDALLKIESNTYGVCEVSGEAIEEERLIANPAARTCMAHTQK